MSVEIVESWLESRRWSVVSADETSEPRLESMEAGCSRLLRLGDLMCPLILRCWMVTVENCSGVGRAGEWMF